MAHVEFEVEVWVVDQEGLIKSERNLCEPAAERLEEMEPLRQLLLPRRIRVVARGVGASKDRHARDVSELGRGLELQEGGVDSAQLRISPAHVQPVCWTIEACHVPRSAK